jgi:hypothetical protein
MLGRSAASTGAAAKAINATAAKILIAIFLDVNFLIVNLLSFLCIVWLGIRGNRFWKVGYHPLYYFLWPPLQFLGEQHEYGWPGFLGFHFFYLLRLMVLKPNPDKPIVAKRKSRFIGELKIEDLLYRFAQSLY